MTISFPPPSRPLSTPIPWDLVAHGYNDTSRHFLRRFSEAGLAMLRLDPEMDALDVACGPGTMTLPLAAKVRRVTAVDFSLRMLEELEANLAAAGITNVDTLQGDGQALDLLSESFDIGTSMFGLMFFPERKAGLSELFRVVRPRGQVLLSSWAPWSRSSLMCLMFDALREADPDFQVPQADMSSLENPAVFEEELRVAGFEQVKVHEVTRDLEVKDVAEFWEQMVSGSAPMALMKRGLGEQRWAEQEARALSFLESKLARLPAKLDATAYLALGVVPG